MASRATVPSLTAFLEGNVDREPPTQGQLSEEAAVEDRERTRRAVSFPGRRLLAGDEQLPSAPQLQSHVVCAEATQGYAHVQLGFKTGV